MRLTLACCVTLGVCLMLSGSADAARFVVVPSVEPGLIPDDEPFSLGFWLELDPGEEVQSFGVELEYWAAQPVEWFLPPDVIGLQLDPFLFVNEPHPPWDLAFHLFGPLTGIDSRLDYTNLSTPASLENTAWLTEFGFDNRGGTALPLGSVVLQPWDVRPSLTRPLEFEITVDNPRCVASIGGFDPNVPCASLNLSDRQRLTFGIGVVDASILDTPEPGSCLLGVLAVSWLAVRRRRPLGARGEKLQGELARCGVPRRLRVD